MPAPYLRGIWLDKSLVPDAAAYPFCLPLFAKDFELGFDRAITVVAGENGTGKSTLLEGIAALAGYDDAGGGKGYRPVDHSRAVDANGGLLAKALRASWLPKLTPAPGVLLRPEGLHRLDDGGWRIFQASHPRLAGMQIRKLLHDRHRDPDMRFIHQFRHLDQYLLPFILVLYFTGGDVEKLCENVVHVLHRSDDFLARLPLHLVLSPAQSLRDGCAAASGCELDDSCSGRLSRASLSLCGIDVATARAREDALTHRVEAPPRRRK
jgi:energy-coupling factor transporter ATP-binding protein EcfA2